MKSSLTSHCIYTNLTARGNKVGWTAPQSSKGSDLVAEFDKNDGSAKLNLSVRIVRKDLRYAHKYSFRTQ